MSLDTILASAAILGVIGSLFLTMYKIGKFQGQVMEKFESIDKRFESIDKRLDKIDLELKDLNTRVSRIEGFLMGPVAKTGTEVKEN